MANGEMKQSVRKQAAGALERVAELEQQMAFVHESIPKITLSINRRLEVLQNQISHATEILDAVVSVLGEDVISNAIQANRIQKAIQEAEALKARVTAAVEKGSLVPVDTVTEVKLDENGNIIERGSFVEGTEFDAQDEELPPGYVFLQMAEIWPDTRKLLSNAKIGTEVPTFKFEKGAIVRDEQGNPVPSGGKFVIRAIYNQAEPKPEEKSPAEQVDQDVIENKLQPEPQQAATTTTEQAPAATASAE